VVLPNLTIIFTAIIVTLFCLLLLVITQKRLNIPPKNYYRLIIVALPFSIIINLFKIPLLHDLFSSSLTQNSLSFHQIIIWLLIVGVTEETIKVLPVFFPPLNKKIRSIKELTIIGWCLGTGFGIGEIWFLAIQYSFAYGNSNHWLSWITGFGVERFFVVFGHAAFTIIALKGLEKSYWRFTCSFSMAILLHGLYDSPILLYSAGFLNKIEMNLIILMELICVFILVYYLLFVIGTSLNEVSEEQRKKIKTNLLKRAEKATLKDGNLKFKKNNQY
jgi:hypothetical protein